MFCGPKEMLKRWDELNRTHKIVGIGELENHSTIKKLLGYRFYIFPFSKAFRFIRTHILSEAKFLGEDELDRAIILSAQTGQGLCRLRVFRVRPGVLLRDHG